MKNLITILTAILAFSVIVEAEPIERVKNGFGATLTATTTNQEMIIRQIPNRDIVSNGTFSADTDWNKGTGWALGGTVATFTTTNTFSTTSDLYQANVYMEHEALYRIKYTLAGIDPTTNTCQLILGTSVGTTRTASGTYTEDLYLFGGSNILFRAVSTNGSSFTIDNVIARKLSDRATVQYIQLESGPTELPIYFMLNGSDASMTNAYAESQCMILRSNQVLTVDDQSGMKQIDRIWYRTASGSATAIFNGN